jgi:hypothetical protein
MRPRLILVACSFFALCNSACVPINAYVENGHNEADFRDLHGNGPPQQVRVAVEFDVNGKRKPEVEPRVYNTVLVVLQHTNVLQPVNGDPDSTLKIVVDDTFDPNQIRNDALQTGVTMGMTGVTARDTYHFFMTLKGPEGKPRVGSYRHAMITVAGRDAKTPPSYGQPLSADEAFDVIVKQSILEFLSDLQSEHGDEPVMLVPDNEPPPTAGRHSAPETPP